MLVSSVQQSATATCVHKPLCFGFPSHAGHHRALNRVPCAVQEVLISDLFYTQHQYCADLSPLLFSEKSLGSILLAQERETSLHMYVLFVKIISFSKEDPVPCS